MEWISVKDKLPRVHKDVLVWVIYDNGIQQFTTSWKEKQIGSFWYKDPYSNCLWAMGSASGYKVTHWMPIDKPTKK